MSSGVAVVIVNWNSGQLLSQCLAALTSQTARIDSIVVVDNASNDGSLAAVENRYPHVNINRLDRNIGFAAANNHAVSLLNDVAWIALLNPDAVPEPNWLEELTRATG
ncbi:MAG: glycosyltransferase family 2 protein, partial [Planctomycetota bacterium]